MLNLHLFIYETTSLDKEVQSGFKLPDHNYHSRLRLLVNGGGLLLLPGEPYLEPVRGKCSHRNGTWSELDTAVWGTYHDWLHIGLLNKAAPFPPFHPFSW